MIIKFDIKHLLEPLKSWYLSILRYQTSFGISKSSEVSDPRSVTSQDPCDHRKVPRRATRICATTAALEPRWEPPTCGFTDGFWLMGEGWLKIFHLPYGPLNIRCWIGGLVGFWIHIGNEWFNQFSDEEIGIQILYQIQKLLVQSSCFMSNQLLDKSEMSVKGNGFEMYITWSLKLFILGPSCLSEPEVREDIRQALSIGHMW